MVNGLLVTFTCEMSEDELARAVMELSKLPGVGTVEPVERDPHEQVVYQRARREIEGKLLAAISADVEPEMLNRLLRAIYADKPLSTN